jgi:hypothetical protein
MNLKDVLIKIIKEDIDSFRDDWSSKGSTRGIPSLRSDTDAVSSKDRAEFLLDKAMSQLASMGIHVGTDYMDDIYTLKSFESLGTKEPFDFKFVGKGGTKFSGKCLYDKQKSNNYNTLVLSFIGKTDKGKEFKRFIFFDPKSLGAPFLGGQRDFPGLKDKEKSLPGVREGGNYPVKFIKPKNPSKAGPLKNREIFKHGFSEKPENVKNRAIKIVEIGIENKFLEKFKPSKNKEKVLFSDKKPMKVSKVKITSPKNPGLQTELNNLNNWHVKLVMDGLIVIDPKKSTSDWFIHVKPKNLPQNEWASPNNWSDVEVELKSRSSTGIWAVVINEDDAKITIEL